MNNRRKLIVALGASALAGVLAGASAFANAQAYPTRPIRVVVPYPAGGGVDLLARSLAQSLTEALGQQVIVENRGGAGGNLGMEFVAKSPPDGYTLVLGLTAQFAVNPSLYPKLPYDAVRDYAPVALLVSNPLVFSVHPALPKYVIWWRTPGQEKTRKEKHSWTPS